MTEKWTAAEYRAYHQANGKGSMAIKVTPGQVSGPDTVHKGNQKIRNATKVSFEGIKFDSVLEEYCYKRLAGAQIAFQLKRKYVLLEAFTYLGENIGEMAMFPDFYLPEHNLILETKGHANDVFPLKLKWLKAALAREGKSTRYVICRTKKDVDSLVHRLIHGLTVLSDYDGQP